MVIVSICTVDTRWVLKVSASVGLIPELHPCIPLRLSSNFPLTSFISPTDWYVDKLTLFRHPLASKSLGFNSIDLLKCMFWPISASCNYSQCRKTCIIIYINKKIKFIQYVRVIILGCFVTCRIITLLLLTVTTWRSFSSIFVFLIKKKPWGANPSTHDLSLHLYSPVNEHRKFGTFFRRSFQNTISAATQLKFYLQSTGQYVRAQILRKWPKNVASCDLSLWSPKRAFLAN